MGLHVVEPGILSLIQDLGRTGVAQHGLSVGGPMDLHAFCWANYLVGNPPNSAGLEITMGNAAFIATDSVTLSLCGADLSPRIDGQPIEQWRSFHLQAGQTLELGYAKSGLRAYLAIQGGFDVPTVFNSVATVMRNGLGGLASHPGTPLRRGDELPCKITAKASLNARTNWVPRHFIPRYDNTISVELIESYQASQFSLEAKRAFYEKPYRVTDKMDRMGMRLQGNSVACNVSGIISEGIALGAVQFPANGQPIILFNDRQTLGGYPKLGCVAKLSLFKLAQARPGCQLNFYRTDVKQASYAYSKFLKFFAL
jgi:allophanate hydrolase